MLRAALRSSRRALMPISSRERMCCSHERRREALVLPPDVKDAARLIEWGLHPRALPEAHPEYRDLVRRWMDDGAFKTLVASVAEGLKLRVVGVTARTGIVLGT